MTNELKTFKKSKGKKIEVSEDFHEKMEEAKEDME